MEQPNFYNNEEELIEWLIYDLEEQRKGDIKKDEELILNIGNKDIKKKINFEFDFSAIIKKLNINNYEIYYKVNCSNLIFNKTVDFSEKKYNNKIVIYKEKIIKIIKIGEMLYLLN